MAGHDYTGITGKIVVEGSIEGFVEADVKIGYEMGDAYVEQGDESIRDHVFGLIKVSGTIKRAWGKNSGYMKDWHVDKEEKTIRFDPGDGTGLYTCSGCILTDLEFDPIKAGEAKVLALKAPFVGKTWSTTDTAD